MTITSFGFLILIFVGGICYYVFPKTWQWVELLVLSIVFCCMASSPYTLIFVLISTLTAWGATNFLPLDEKNTLEKAHKAKIIVVAAILINLSLWFVFKGSGYWLPLFHKLAQRLTFMKKVDSLPIEALGMSYYTLQVIAYILDVYWGTVRPQKNIAKLFLFVCFFPQMVTGPISRYNELEGLYQEHSFSYENITHGAQRVLWGFLKKLVLAERVAVIVNEIWGALETYQGLYCWIVFLLYPLQLYADFSGCMDIVIGTAEIFGIKLAENFENPFFARTVQAFWQKWHITLGSWAKDYVLYPLLKSKFIIGLGRKTKKQFGKRFGKLIPTAIGMLALWMTMGIWHGAFRYIAGVSLWYWLILMLGEFCTPILEKSVKYLGIQRENFSWHLFQSVRTYLIFSVGAIFFRASCLRDGMYFLRNLLSIFQAKYANIWVLFDGSLAELAGGAIEINIIIFAIILLFIVAVLRDRYGYARIWVAKQGFVFRWMVWLGLFFFVLIYGIYGPGYDAAEFIYQGF